ncbi:hypothetical protein MJH12_12100 [bacterium]|nr:hypothetical protein [bacterium]
MRLDFDFQQFHSDAKLELGLEDFLKQIEVPTLFLAQLKLNLLDESQCRKQYQEIASCIQKLPRKVIEQILEYYLNISNLDYLLIDAQNRSLDQIQLKQLGDFCMLDQKISQIESQYDFSMSESLDHSSLVNILDHHLRDQFSTFSPVDSMEKVKIELQKCSENFQKKIALYEQEIHDITQLKLYFPYSKEMLYEEKLYKELSQCDLIILSKRDDMMIVDFNLPTQIQEIQSDRKALLDQHQNFVEELLKNINVELSCKLNGFSNYIEQRKYRLYIYALSSFSHKHNLCIPNFDTDQVVFEQARLHSLEKNCQNYKALNLHSKTGASILFGANMTGKTSVLKTLYFQYCLMKLAIPLPAKSVQCFFPKSLLLKLKNSGSIQKKMSSFGEEIQFWTQEFEEQSIILCDELFLNTEAAAGEIISKVIIDYIKKKKLFFMASSHYTNLLDLNDVNLFYMKSLISTKHLDHHDLLGQIPFELAPITKNDKMCFQTMKNEAIQLALCFDLPSEIKDQLTSYLKG